MKIFGNNVSGFKDIAKLLSFFIRTSITSIFLLTEAKKWQKKHNRTKKAVNRQSPLLL